ncbi:aminoacyl--tRNA ligase-related protein [Deinococcus maricopensis]|uniref:Proline--tRNA ligase n=1 Tax=Deinococcus maricopensis (strain DSM 21211 / LMG 22137 / NRRL B-23946 / LB-34) TaxID=709986 RepID=E8UB73_DEIML|nr:aminoacyl--tRNA ligase-related protein [Deinococcus maricopensis]ADV68312.1 prolyl-tRNA synthetase [Deinococcus maricopensis DSM 21211]
MRWSALWAFTSRAMPSEADVASHQWLVRAGFVERVGAGLYASLPLMSRVEARLEALVHAEMRAVGAQEVRLPMLQPAALWAASGRWDAYRAEGLMFSLADRAGRALTLAPTHEEAVAFLARGLRREADLPKVVYQVGRKFRDELRPRGGLLRAREFTMKDAYSVHADEVSLAGTFEAMSGAYARLLGALGVPWRAVEADSGSIGGAVSREFMVLSDIGEDTVLTAPDGVAVNVERAVSLPDAAPGVGARVDAWTVTFADGAVVGVRVRVRADHAVNGVKLARVVAGLSGQAVVDAREGIAAVQFEVTDGACPGVGVGAVADVRVARAGERTAHAPQQRWVAARGIEVGHAFQLGARYTEALGARFVGADGSSRAPLMGCYGIGVSRLAQAVAEVTCDGWGLNWPAVIAPFGVVVTVTNSADAAQREAGERVYGALVAAGVDALLDDRAERAGVKLRDAEMIGVPLRVTVGRDLAAGNVELFTRRSRSCEVFHVDAVVGAVQRSL